MILLGNLTTEQMQERLGVTFPDELVKFLNERHQANASQIMSGKWHCFDIPFSIVCGDIGTAQFIYDHLKDKQSSMKETLQISLQS